MPIIFVQIDDFCLISECDEIPYRKYYYCSVNKIECHVCWFDLYSNVLLMIHSQQAIFITPLLCACGRIPTVSMSWCLYSMYSTQSAQLRQKQKRQWRSQCTKVHHKFCATHNINKSIQFKITNISDTVFNVWTEWIFSKVSTNNRNVFFFSEILLFSINYFFFNFTLLYFSIEYFHLM